MANKQAQEPLLTNKFLHNDATPKTTSNSLWLSLAKFALKSLMWLLFLAWIITIAFFPSQFIKSLFSKFTSLTEHTIFGLTGSVFLVFAGPLLLISFLAFIYITFFPHEHSIAKKKSSPWLQLWTFPLLVDGPLGVITAAEFIGIALFLLYVVWSIIFYAVQTLSSRVPFHEGTEWRFLEVMGLRLGSIGLFCLLFLFLPVARGSILLRLVDIPFEQATRYHVWLGHLTMFIFTLHGLFYVISWSMDGKLLPELLQWKDIGIANLPGVISLAAGLLMWVTSLRPVRKNYFELFFYTHQLYIVFIVFLALHVGDFVFSICAGAVFLFLLDRFIRFLQSRKTVDVLSAVCRPCGTVELVLSKPANLRYNALSFVFVQVRELSWLQWHPFSVSSSPLDGNYHMSILIKVLGTWTAKLRNLITDSEEQRKDVQLNPKRITASVEGPYGHESPYHLMYENIILVAGGIGISPFLAIISDVCHRIAEGKPCLPKNVTVIWAVKNSKELSLISVLDGQSFPSSFSDKVNLDIQAYVTQESEPSLEEGKVNDNKSYSLFTISGNCMSSLVGTGSNKWFTAYVAVSTIGFILLFGLVEVYFIKPFGITAWWLRGLLFLLCMVAGVVFLGGIVAVFWHYSEKKDSLNKELADGKQNGVESQAAETGNTNFSSFQTTRYGCRPNFKDIFTSFSDQMGSVDVGVIVCGPPGLQTSVARECRSQNMRRRGSVFHYNCHSFDL